MTRAEFEALYTKLFPSAPASVVANAFASLDVEGAGRVDLISWTHRIHLADMPALVERIRKHGGCQDRGGCMGDIRGGVKYLAQHTSHGS